jgi:tungstate transport system substrate-binding protein
MQEQRRAGTVQGGCQPPTHPESLTPKQDATVCIRSALTWTAILLAVLMAGCGGGASSRPRLRDGTPAPPRASGELLLASTTTTQDSGLLDVLLPAFEKETGYSVKLIAGGSGQAIANGERGDVDVLLVHSPAAEEAMITAGDGIERALVMHNDFVIVGPANDPAGVRSAADAAAAFRSIASKGTRFMSRGDDSGTNVFELQIWKNAGVTPQGKSWYSESGQGQGATLQIASQRQAYALADRGTYLALEKQLDLKILYQNSGSLLNVYHVIVVNPKKHPKVHVAAARAFAAWIVRPDVQAMIGTFGVTKYGQPLFVPDAGKPEPAG